MCLLESGTLPYHLLFCLLTHTSELLATSPLLHVSLRILSSAYLWWLIPNHPQGDVLLPLECLPCPSLSRQVLVLPLSSLQCHVHTTTISLTKHRLSQLWVCFLLLLPVYFRHRNGLKLLIFKFQEPSTVPGIRQTLNMDDESNLFLWQLVKNKNYI